MRTIDDNRITRSAPLGGVAAAIALAVGLAGCAQIMDSSAPPKAPEQSVIGYYNNLKTPGARYQYALTSRNAFLPVKDTLTMAMQGADTWETFNGMPMWWCQWSYATAGNGEGWYYALCDTEAVALGVEINGQYTDQWIDLKAPLAQNNSWSFTSQGEHVTATVTQYKISASMNKKQYDDVIVVNYIGDMGTTGTNWFAPGIGTIYSHIVRPHSGQDTSLVDLQFQSMTQ